MKKLIVVSDPDTEYVSAERVIAPSMDMIALRSGGNLAGQSFLLVPHYDWVLGRDSGGAAVLVALKPED